MVVVFPLTEPKGWLGYAAYSTAGYASADVIVGMLPLLVEVWALWWYALPSMLSGWLAATLMVFVIRAHYGQPLSWRTLVAKLVVTICAGASGLLNATLAIGHPYGDFDPLWFYLKLALTASCIMVTGGLLAWSHSRRPSVPGPLVGVTRRRRLAVTALVLVAGVGLTVIAVQVPQDSRHDLALGYSGEFKTIGEDLRVLAGKMPPDPIEGSKCAGLDDDERPFRTVQEDRPANIEFVMYDRLTDPAANPEQFDPFDSGLHDYILAVEPDFEPDYYEWRTPATDSDWDDIQQLLQIQYVGMARITNLDVPKISDGKVRGGRMTVEAVIADLRSHKILCTVSAEADAHDEVVFRAQDGVAEQLHQEVTELESALPEAGVTALQDALNKLGRGTFAFPHRP